MNEIDAAPFLVSMAVLRDIFRLKKTLIAQRGQPLVQPVEVVTMNKEIQIHRRPDMTQNTQSETADRRVSNLSTVEFHQQRFHHALEVHAVIVNGRLWSRKPANARENIS